MRGDLDVHPQGFVKVVHLINKAWPAEQLMCDRPSLLRDYLRKRTIFLWVPIVYIYGRPID